jgi:hypothetical protein
MFILCFYFLYLFYNSSQLTFNEQKQRNTPVLGAGSAFVLGKEGWVGSGK